MELRPVDPTAGKVRGRSISQKDERIFFVRFEEKEKMEGEERERRRKEGNGGISNVRAGDGWRLAKERENICPLRRNPFREKEERFFEERERVFNHEKVICPDE